jgi:hypothetical protein
MAGHTGDINDRVPLVVNTVENGYNCGRQYIFSLDSEERFLEWSKFIEEHAKASLKAHHNLTSIQRAKVLGMPDPSPSLPARLFSPQATAAR